jgi:predicted RNA-binding protein Jag
MANNQKVKSIENSFVKISGSDIDIVLGDGGKLLDSVNNIKDSTIKLR